MSSVSMKFIFELTLAERSLSNRNYAMALKFIKAIHVISSMDLSGRSEQEIRTYIDEFFQKDICDAECYASFIRRISNP